MRSIHIIPRFGSALPTGTLSAKVIGDQDIQTNQIKIAYDYFNNDKKLRLSIGALQTGTSASGDTSISGMELTFDADITSGTHFIKDKKFFATYWYIWKNNDIYKLCTYDADTGSATINFNIEAITYDGTFSFESNGPDIPGDSFYRAIKSGSFSFKGLNNFAI